MTHFLKFLKKIPLLDWLSLGVLALAGYVLCRHLSQISDLELGDEAYYGYIANHFFPERPIRGDWGPLYSLWYLFLRIFETDSVRLYFLNMVVLSTLAPLALYVGLRSAGQSWWFALYFSLVFAFSPLNVPIGVKISVLIFILSMMMLFIARYKNLLAADSLALLTVFATLFAYMRPENILVAGAAVVMGVGLRLYQKQILSPIFFSLIPLLVLVVCIGLPVSDKATLTFQQDFSANYAIMYPEKVKNLNGWIDYDKIVQIAFGQKVVSVPQALQINPMLYFEAHILANHRGIVDNIKTIILDLFSPFAWIAAKIPHKSKIALLLVLLFLASIDPRKIRVSLAEVWQQTGRALLFLMAILAGVAFASYYSSGYKIRYWVLCYAFLPILIGAIWQFWVLSLRSFVVNDQLKKVLQTGAGALFFGLVFLFLTQQNDRLAAINRPQTSVARVRYYQKLVSSLSHNREIVAFDPPDQLGTHVNWKCITWSDYKRDNTFSRFVADKKITFLYFHKFARDYYSTDSSFRAFIEKPPANFTKIYNAPDDEYIFVEEKHLAAVK